MGELPEKIEQRHYEKTRNSGLQRKRGHGVSAPAETPAFFYEEKI